MAARGAHIANARAIVAIDFGTTNSGAAYAFCAEAEPRVFSLEFPGVSDVKVPTSVVLEKSAPYRAIGFGPSVIEMFEEEEHAIFHRFKMQLYDNPQKKKLKADVGNLELPAEIVIARCLNVLKERTLAQAREQQRIELASHEIMWVLTVPAIWPESSKQLMRKAAVEAGMIPEISSDRLLLALEPECAAIECQKHLNFLRQGVRYAVLDCGGGTVDTTVYEVKVPMPNFELQELHRAGGGDFGSTVVDAQFVAFLRELLGDYECLQQNSFALFDLLTNVWEDKKVRFGREQLENPTGMVAINLNAILDHMPSHVNLRDQVTQYNQRHPNNPALRVFGACNLKIPVTLMRSFFNRVLDRVEGHLQELLTTVRGVQYVLLLGGFAGSTLLQDTVRDVCQRNGAEIVIPPRPWLAIVLGAVQFGLRPEAISLRRARFTYGIRMGRTFQPGKDPEDRKEWDDKLKKYMCKSVLSKFVTQNDKLEIDQHFEHIFHPRHDDQSRATFKILGASRPDVNYTDERGVFELGSLTIDIPQSYHGRARSLDITCSMEFGLTEIKVSVSFAGGTAKRVNINYNN